MDNRAAMMQPLQKICPVQPFNGSIRNDPNIYALKKPVHRPASYKISAGFIPAPGVNLSLAQQMHVILPGWNN
jgi:hypothetical protein